MENEQATAEIIWATMRELLKGCKPEHAAPAIINVIADIIVENSETPRDMAEGLGAITVDIADAIHGKSGVRIRIDQSLEEVERDG